MDLFESARTVSIMEEAEGIVPMLKRSGDKYRGCCPFHGGSNPTEFVIYPKTNSFYCFSCQESGDVIQFTLLSQGLPKREDAAKHLCEKNNIPYDTIKRKSAIERQRERERREKENSDLNNTLLSVARGKREKAKIANDEAVAEKLRNDADMAEAAAGFTISEEDPKSAINTKLSTLRFVGATEEAEKIEIEAGDRPIDTDGFPPFIDAADALENMAELPEELVEGLLRRGDQMLIAGGSKTSKSFLALELAVAVATGRDWLGNYHCRRGRVLYLNGEIRREIMERRLDALLQPTGETEKTGIDRSELRGHLIFNHLRGYTVTISQICARIERGPKFDLIIVDPIYLVGDVKDENDAAAVLRFLRELGNLAEKTGASIIAVHHHSKGQQGGKRSIDRASGSGAFGRWFDAILDISVLNVPAGIAEQAKSPGSIGMRLEYDLRNYAQPKPLSIWWKYPRHWCDPSGELDGCHIEGDTRANLKQYQEGETKEIRKTRNDEEIAKAIENIVANGGKPTIAAVAKAISKSEKTIRNWLEDSDSVINYGGLLRVENRK